MSKKFEVLSEFLSDTMQMTKIYQPIMIAEILIHGGKATANQIAEAISGPERKNVEYFKRGVIRNAGPVLSEGRDIVVENSGTYFLKGFEELTQTDIFKLIMLCDCQANDFIDRSGAKAWEKGKPIYIPGLIKYLVLRRAKKRCEICWTSDEVKPLDAVHIVPRKLGGSDDESNLQALCSACIDQVGLNTNKALSHMHDSYGHRDGDCVLCDVSHKSIIAENELAFLMHNADPVTELHSLIIPKRHVSDFFELYQPERNAMNELLEMQRRNIMEYDKRVKGFNVGNDIGALAGQTIMHSHTHLIPRRSGDNVKSRSGTH